MSDGGGDMGGDGGGGGKGGGDAGGGGKGGGADTGQGGYDSNGYYTPPTSYSGSSDFTGTSSYAPTSGTGGGTVDDFVSNPTSYSGSSDFTGTSSYAPTSGTGGGTVDDFVSNPTGSTSPFDTGTTPITDPTNQGGNLSGSGPPGGDIGLPGAGGGTNTPFAFDNSSYLSGLDQYGGTPVSAGGVFDTGTSAVPGLSSSDVPGQSAFSTVTGSTAAAPGGASAAGTAAPSAVAGNPDATTSTDLSSLAKRPSSTGNAGNGVTGSSGGILDSLGIGKGNMASTAISGAALLNNLINGKTAPPQSAPLTANASQANAVAGQQTSAGQALQQWQTTGTLPASYESQIQQAANAAKQRAISNAAAQGLPTDPTLNTTLAQNLQAIDAAIPQQREQIAAQLAQSGQQMINAGLQATGISSSVYKQLADLDNAQNTARGNAIANFASALNGGNNRGVVLKVA